MDATISKYVELIEQFVSGAIDAAAFESAYLRMFKSESAHLPDTAFTVLDQLFSDVDAFCADAAIRTLSDLDEDALRIRPETALRELTAVAQQH